MSYDGNYYSVPSDYTRKTLQVQETEDGQLIVLDAHDEETTRHHLVEGRHQRVAVAAHYDHLRYGSRSNRRPGAIQVPVPQSLADLPAAPEVGGRDGLLQQGHLRSQVVQEVVPGLAAVSLVGLPVVHVPGHERDTHDGHGRVVAKLLPARRQRSWTAWRPE